MPPTTTIPRRRVTALLDFLRSESAGGAALILSAVAALIWANSGASALYDQVLHANLGPFSLHVWVNDGLMALFFLLVGLELRREITVGELASRQRLAAPGLAALGGMVVPALIYVAFNWHSATALRGWAVPVATDIAFALAVLSVLGRRVPIGLKVFLTALAIIDDLGAILVIALFYSQGLNLPALGGAALVWLGLYGLNRAGVRVLWPYLLGGVVLWALVVRSGVHATLAGVALAFIVPQGGARVVTLPQKTSSSRAPWRSDPGATGALLAPGSLRQAARDDGPAERLEHALGSWIAYLVLPLFGLANAGLRFDTLPAGVWLDRMALGTALGLFVGKQIGVFGAVMAASRLGLARLPAGVTVLQLYGGAVLCGIGFTMSLFIGELAFRGGPSGDEIKVAVFTGSIVSALAGLAILAAVSPRSRSHAPPPPATRPLS